MWLTSSMPVRTKLTLAVKDSGVICVISPQGEMIGRVVVPDYPEIMGMQFSKTKPMILYVTENSDKPICLRLLVNNESLEKSSKERKNQIDAYDN